jgi:NAD-dependent deacetylase
MRKIKPARFIFLTGAGVSVLSGLRPLHGDNGMLNDPDVVRLSRVEALHQDIGEVWRFFGDLRRQMVEAEPNVNHRLLASFEKRIGSDRVLLVTQNIDDLHQRGGSHRVIGIHGSLLRSRCGNAHCLGLMLEDRHAHKRVPRCPECRQSMRPDIVFFGERVPAKTLSGVATWVRPGDVFVAVGTSLLVTPAALLVSKALDAGATTISLNIEPVAPAMRRLFTRELIGKAEDLLPHLLEDLAGVA